jgi:hypothetical protein
MICNGNQIPIKGNLGSALIHIRHSLRARAIWADALCINQYDPIDVTEQIQAMREIYSQAYRTIVWLGMDENFDTLLFGPQKLRYPEAAMAILCHIVKQWDPSQPARYYVTERETQLVEAKEQDLDCDFARDLDIYLNSSQSLYSNNVRELEYLFKASWFSRKWVIQEVALSRSVDVLFHNCRISWRWIGLAAAIMRTKYDATLREHRIYNVYKAYLMFRLSEQHDLVPARMTFVELLRLTAGFKTSKPKDVFYAILGMETSDHHPERQPLLEADPFESYEDTCISLAQSALQASRSGPNPLAILLDAGISGSNVAKKPEESSEDEQESTETTESMPSWVPSWKPDQPSLLSPWSLDESFNASKGLQPYLDVGSSHLTVQGTSVSTVLQTCPTAIASENDIASSIDWLSTFPFTQPIARSHLEVYSRTLCAGRDSYGGRERDRAAMVLPFVAFAIYGALPDKKPYHWINMARKALPKPQQDPWDHEKVSSGSYYRRRSEWNTEWVTARERFGQIAGLAARGRRLFLTASGHVGLGPRETTIGDIVCILGGSSMPLILRTGDGKCKVLVGPCFVDDIMDGEAVSAAKSKNSIFGPLWSDSFRESAKQVETGSAVDGPQIREIIIQ